MRDYVSKYFRNCQPLHWVVINVSASVGDRLNYHAAHGRVVDAKAHNFAEFVFIDTAFDSGDQCDVEVDFSQAIQRLEFQFEQVRAANDFICPAVKAIELEVDRRP